MSIEIQLLVYTGLVLLLLTLAQGVRNVLVLDLPTAAGNRTTLQLGPARTPTMRCQRWVRRSSFSLVWCMGQSM